MQARGLLMIEHRLIERMLTIIQEKLAQLKEPRKIDPFFVDKAVDFIQTYADRTHHGKEEDILFRDLAQKDMTSEEQKVMGELIQEHVLGRKTVADLVDSKKRHFAGDDSAVGVVIEKVEFLMSFYPRHIEKEDKVFFPAMMRYFTVEAQERMLREFWEFDRNMIHRKYRDLVEELAR